MDELVKYIAMNLVDKPEEVKVVVKEGERSTIIELSVAPDDHGQGHWETGADCQGHPPGWSRPLPSRKIKITLWKSCDMAGNDFLRIGLVVKPQGVRGELKVQP